MFVGNIVARMGWFCLVATFPSAYANVKRVSVGPLLNAMKMCAQCNNSERMTKSSKHLFTFACPWWPHTRRILLALSKDVSLSVFITTDCSLCVRRKGLQWKYLKFICGWMDPENSWMLIEAKMYGARLMRFVLKQFCAECVFVFQCIQFDYNIITNEISFTALFLIIIIFFGRAGWLNNRSYLQYAFCPS